MRQIGDEHRVDPYNTHVTQHQGGLFVLPASV
jgi:hypothetical protein